MSKCEHGLTSAECFVCASPKYGKPAAPAPDADAIMALAGQYAAMPGFYDQHAAQESPVDVLDEYGDKAAEAEAILRAAIEQIVRERDTLKAACEELLTLT